MSDDDPETLWGFQAAREARRTGLPLDACYDRVIAEWLWKGDATPLADWLYKRGQWPGPNTLKNLLWLLLEDSDLKVEKLDGSLHPVPYQIVMKRRNGRRGRPSAQDDDPEIAVRDVVLAENIVQLMSEGCYESAIAQMVQDAKDHGFSLSPATFRRAYRKHKHSLR